MQNLDRYTKKTHVEIHSRFMSVLIIGSIALVGLVFALGVLVGSRQAEAAIHCPEPDPLALLDMKSDEPSPPQGQDQMHLSFHESLAAPEDQVPVPASLQDSKSSKPISGSADAAKAARPSSLAATRMAEEPIPEKVGLDEPGFYSLQVGSFDNRREASRLISRLERAGHRAFLVSVNMPERGGLWYRVRVGPFQSKSDAWSYKKEFEERERLPAFVVKRRAKS
ncbi:MAG: SPOR domain-containing protein [Myxococcota bacterium]|nr:SPOR domain-containing protein [Myxococcota bacterium]